MKNQAIDAQTLSSVRKDCSVIEPYTVQDCDKKSSNDKNIADKKYTFTLAKKCR
ncbi:hypothetical protein ACNKHW_26010 [Shigella flexneri]